jgi:hypothetical protein
VSGEQAVEDADRGRLAGAVVAEEPHDLAGVHAEGQPIERPYRTEVAAEVTNVQELVLTEIGHSRGL